MKPKFSVVLALMFYFLCFSPTEAQTAPNNSQIPADLLITLIKQGGWGGRYSEMTVNASGEFSYQSRGGFPAPSPITNFVLLNGKKLKPPRYLKPKLSAEKLKSLIAEFERIQFFKFGKDFPQDDMNESLSLSDQATETISIRINGQTKEVSNYLGDNLKRNRLLRELAEKIRGANVWNYENGKIPDNFQVRHQITDGNKIQLLFEIESNGKVTKSIFSAKPFSIKTKKVGKLSKLQLQQLIDEFERVGFSAFRYSPLNKYDGCSDEPVSPESERHHISVRINYNEMYASLYENCNPKPETDAAKFEYMNEVITRLLKNINVIK